MTLLDFDTLVPEHTQHAIENYIIHGLMPGSFLESVIVNDLFGSFSRADEKNRVHLHYIVRWFMDKAPMDSFGSIENMRNWLNNVDNIRSSYVAHLKKQKFYKVMSND